MTSRLTPLLLLGASICVACGGTQVPSMAQKERARLKALSAPAVVEGEEPASEVPPRTLALRRNPAPCECPPFEVLLDNEWLRVEIDAASDEVEAALGLDLDAAARETSLKRWSITGHVAPEKVGKHAGGQSAVRVEVVSVSVVPH